MTENDDDPRLDEGIDPELKRHCDEGLAALRRGDGVTALKHFERLVELFSERAGPTYYRTMVWKAFCAQALSSQGRFEEAMALQNVVIAERTDALGADHRDTLETRGQLGQTLARQKRFDESRFLQEELYVDKIEALGPNDPSTLNTLGNLADLYVFEGRYAEATYLYRELLARRMQALGPDDPDTSRTARTLEHFATADDLDEPAFERLTDHLDETLRLHGSDGEQAATARGYLACEHLRYGDGSAAIALLLPFTDVRAKERPIDDPDTLRTQQMLVEAIDYVGIDADDPAELEPLINEFTSELGPLNLATVRAKAYYLGLLIQSGDIGPADVAAFQAELHDALPPDHPIHDDLERFFDAAVQTFIMGRLLDDLEGDETYDDETYDDDETVDLDDDGKNDNDGRVRPRWWRRMIAAGARATARGLRRYS